jgi:hypothetical protein
MKALGRLERRLEDLEARSRASREAEEIALTRAVMRRLTDDELRAYVDVLRRMRDGEEPEEKDEPILVRVKELREEVMSSEHQATPR